MKKIILFLLILFLVSCVNAQTGISLDVRNAKINYKYNRVYLEVFAINNSDRKIVLLKPTNMLVRNQRKTYGGRTTYLGLENRPYELIIYSGKSPKKIRVNSITISENERYNDALSSTSLQEIKPGEVARIGALNLTYANYKFDQNISEYSLQIVYDPVFNYECVDDKFVEKLQIKFEEFVKHTEELNKLIEQSDVDSFRYQYTDFFKERFEFYKRYEQFIEKIYANIISSEIIKI